MIPTIVSPTEFRKNLASFLEQAEEKPVVVTGHKTNKVILNEREFNRLSALAGQFLQEDPEGEYRPGFIKEMLSRSKKSDYDTSVKSLDDLL